MTKTMHSRRFAPAVLFIVFILAAASGSIAADFSYRTVVLTGQHPPGTEPDASFWFLSVPQINELGQVAFNAGLEGASVDAMNRYGVWSEAGGSLRLVARTGMAAPGLGSDVAFSSGVGIGVFNGVGQTMFGTRLQGPGVDDTNNSSLWLEQNGVMQLVARNGADAPGASGAKFRDFDGVALNGAGQIALRSNLIGEGVTHLNGKGIWSGGVENLNLIVRSGSHAPDTPSDIVFVDFFGATVLNGSGETAFIAPLATSEGHLVSYSNGTGIWSQGGGSLHMVARAGSAAPGTPVGVNFDTFYLGGSPVINNDGQTAFMAPLIGAGVDLTNDVGVYLEEAGNLQLVAREGSPAPGTEAGTVFAHMSARTSPILSSGGRVTFSANLTGPGVDDTNQVGIWSGVARNLKLVVRQGDPAPGTGDGVTFKFMNPPSLNSLGQIAFKSTLIGPGVDFTNDVGIWAEGPRGLELVIREGDLLEVLPGDLRKVLQLNFLQGRGNEVGQASGFNDRGQLAFWINFTDGSNGIFVADLGTVPEPTTATLGVAAAVLLLLRRRSLP